MLCRNISDQLLNQDCLTYTGTAEQTDLSTFLVRAEEVNDLDTCLKDLCLCGLFLKARGFRWIGSFFSVFGASLLSAAWMP